MANNTAAVVQYNQASGLAAVAPVCCADTDKVITADIRVGTKYFILFFMISGLFYGGYTTIVIH